jgi:(4-O-methyl)-D-glucuronate---lignin esterase
MNPAFFLVLMMAAPVGRASGVFRDAKDLPVQTNLPNVMTMDNGPQATTLAQWQKRREEIKAVLEYYELGHPPPPPGNVKGKIIRAQDFLNGTAQYRLVHLSFGPHHKLGFDVAVFTPAGQGPFPTIIMPSTITPGDDFTNNSATAAKSPSNPARAVVGFTNILDRGYAIVTYRHTECGVDNQTYRSTAFFPAYPGYDWGEMMGWAWGFSRVVDYLETQPFVDRGKLIGVGHSRRGKIVMTAAAFDDRIALVAPGGSGCMGSSSYRFCGPGRGGKEGIEAMIHLHYFWYTSRFLEFSNRVYQVPFDAHWVAALIAPRPYLAVDATEDVFCVPNAVRQTYLAAKPVYEFLDNPDGIGVHFEDHPHELASSDWTAILDFADQKLRGIDHHRTFDQFPPNESATNSAVAEYKR